MSEQKDQPIRAAVWKENYNSISAEDKDVQAKAVELLGPLVKDRKYHLSTYKQCFDVREALTTLQTSSTCSSVDSAIELLQQLVHAGKIYHVVSDHDVIKNQQLYFRLARADTPSVFSIANERKSFLDWVTAKTSSFGFSKQTLFVVGVDPATQTLNTFKNDIAGEPIQSIAVDNTMDIMYASDFGVDVTKGKDSLSLVFPNSVSREKFVESLVSFGGVVLEEQDDLIKSAASAFEFEAKTNSQEVLKLETFKPKVCVFVNTASG
eukprot:m.163176 g.163176  ORF g.163176 m.163176 type:complete len:265 (-) comp13413_c0_seq1:569-1363(-)